MEATPSGARVRSLSVAHLQDLTWMRIQLETLALRLRDRQGRRVVGSRPRRRTPPAGGHPHVLRDGTGNFEWLTAAGFHTALLLRRSPILERLRRQLYDAAELYRMWSGNLPRHPTRPHVADEHKAIFEAALARDADMAVVLMTRHLETTARHLEAVAPDAGATFGAVDG